MKVIKTQLANGKFKYIAKHNGVETVLVKSSTKEFVEMSLTEWKDGSIDKFQSSTKEVNNLSDFVFQCKALSQYKDCTFHICKVISDNKTSSTEVVIDGNSYDLMRDIENMTGVKF